MPLKSWPNWDTFTTAIDFAHSTYRDIVGCEAKVAQSASKEDAYSNGFHDAVRAAMNLAETAQCDIEHLTEENERLLDALKDRQARCSELAAQLAERQQTSRDLAATLDKAHAEIDRLEKACAEMATEVEQAQQRNLELTAQLNGGQPVGMRRSSPLKEDV